MSWNLLCPSIIFPAICPSAKGFPSKVVTTPTALSGITTISVNSISKRSVLILYEPGVMIAVCRPFLPPLLRKATASW